MLRGYLSIAHVAELVACHGLIQAYTYGLGFESSCGQIFYVTVFMHFDLHFIAFAAYAV